MSFFYDFLDLIGIDDVSNELAFNCILNKGILIAGKFKIEKMEEIEIVLSFNKDKIYIYGENLTIKTMANGEIFITGKVVSVGSLKCNIDKV